MLMNINEIYAAYLQCSSVSIDSRHLPNNCLFVALKGSQSDGNIYVKEALAKGAKYALADDPALDALPGVLLVSDALIALQDLAKWHRSQLQIPVIGLTGSNGKTTSKELLNSVLSQKYQVFATHGNLNNHIGVPLSLLSIKPHHQIAVIEMGANHQREIAFLSEIAQPDWVYITNYGKAHMEGFGGVEGIIKGKSEIYDYARNHGKKALIHADDSIQMQKSEGLERLSFSKNAAADFQIKAHQSGEYIGIEWEGLVAVSQLTGSYNYSNLATACCFGKIFDIDNKLIKKGIESYVPGNNRSEIKHYPHLTLIKDAYNANPSSMEVALDNLAKFSGERLAILGDMYELGEATAHEHQQIIKRAQELNISLITVGKYFAECGISSHNFLNAQELLNYLKTVHIQGKTILVKGSRAVKLETIYPLLES